MKRVLVVGARGMAGHMVFNYFKSLNDYEVFGIARNIEKGKNIFNLDVSNTNQLESIIKQNSFDVIINCIGILNKDAEENPAKAIWYNSYLPHLIADLTKKTETKLIHISTDCVFSGKKGNYYENDLKDGIGFYAQSKALGEVINEKDTTIRTSIIGPELDSHGIGLLNWFLKQPLNTCLKGFSNAFWTGITTLEFAKVIEEILKQNITGLVQVASKEKISKHELISLFNQIYRNGKLNIIKDDHYKVDKSLMSNRDDFKYTVPHYIEMLEAQKKWMFTHSNLYSHYNL